MTVLLVDWLGRGGIAQTTEAWALELRAAGVVVDVVTRPGRELGSGAVAVHAAPQVRGGVRAHRAVAEAAAARIRATRPTVVVVQNYVVPPLERGVYAAARDVGARVVVVVHDHQLHTFRAGTRVGMARQIRGADVVIAHTRYVAEGIRGFAGRTDVEVVPLPAPLGMLRHQPERSALPAASADDHWAGHFGVLQRRYKGGPVVEALARGGVPGWKLLAMGVGAPERVPGLHAVTGYASPGVLLATVAATDVTLAPYTRATQSAVVTLGQLLGSVPVASAVGGIPEQIDNAVDGILVAPGAPPAVWRDALAALRDDEFRKDLAVAGTARAWREHEQFTRAITEFVQ